MNFSVYDLYWELFQFHYYPSCKETAVLLNVLFMDFQKFLDDKTWHLSHIVTFF